MHSPSYKLTCHRRDREPGDSVVLAITFGFSYSNNIISFLVLCFGIGVLSVTENGGAGCTTCCHNNFVSEANSRAYHYTSFHVARPRARNKLARVKSAVATGCCGVSFPIFHYNDLLRQLPGLREVTGKRV